MIRKTTLAKLLAEENINVVHENAKTASFDVVNRELRLPIWDDMSNNVYDLMVCHEVGHALWTPPTMLERMVEENLNKSFVNIIEDARIEQLIQEKYLGAKRAFVAGYKELLQKDFFGINDKDLSKMSLIDRINIFFKTGIDVPFSENDMVWVDRVKTLKTPDDVLDFVRDFEAAKKKEEEESQEEQPAPTDGEGEESGEESPTPQPNEETEDEESGVASTDTDGEGEEEKNEDSSSNDSSEQSESSEESDKSEHGTGNLDAGSGSEDLQEGFTDDWSQEQLENLADDTAAPRTYATLPKSLDLDTLIVDYKTILGDVEQGIEMAKTVYFGNNDFSRFDTFVKEKAIQLKKDNKAIINAMVKEFEMKKSADLYKRAATSKTGTLDMNKLHTYKFNDDIFAKMTNLPGATDHGLVIYLDWSGSMAPNLSDTFRQLMVLVWFCQQVKIPFEVYAFSDNYAGYREPNFQEQTHRVVNLCSNLRLLNLFSSRMKKTELQASLEYFLHYASGNQFSYEARNKAGILTSYSVRGCASKLNLGGTPLNSAIISAIYVTDKFKKETRVQKVNTIFLSDGASMVNETVPLVESEYGWRGEEIKFLNDFILRNPKTNESIVFNEKAKTYDDMTKNWLTVLKKYHSDMNIVGFFIAGSGRSGNVSKDIIKRKLKLGWGDYEKLDAAVKEIKKNKVLVCENQGYDQLYLLPSLPSTDNEELDVKVGATPAQLKKAFMKSGSNKTNNRQLVKKFIEMVA